MFRSLLLCAVGIASGCASAPTPKIPAELIVGTWGCAVKGMQPGGQFRMSFGSAGEMGIAIDARTESIEHQVIVHAQLVGTYLLDGAMLGLMAQTMQIHSLSMSGEQITGDALNKFSRDFVEGINTSDDFVIDTLDSQALVLRSGDGSASCGRQA